MARNRTTPRSGQTCECGNVSVLFICGAWICQRCKDWDYPANNQTKERKKKVVGYGTCVEEHRVVITNKNRNYSYG